MMNKWIDILKAIKNNDEVKLHPATAKALLSRNLIISGKTRYEITHAGKVYIKAFPLITEHRYATLYRKNEKLGMYCMISGSDIVDCYGNFYDLTNVISIQVYGQSKN